MAQNVNVKEYKEWAGGHRYQEILRKVSFIFRIYVLVVELVSRFWNCLTLFENPVFDICKL
jgi:hypothetical protein